MFVCAKKQYGGYCVWPNTYMYIFHFICSVVLTSPMGGNQENKNRREHALHVLTLLSYFCRSCQDVNFTLKKITFGKKTSQADTE